MQASKVRQNLKSVEHIHTTMEDVIDSLINHKMKEIHPLN